MTTNVDPNVVLMERALLASARSSASVAAQIAAIVSPEDFAVPAHAELFEIIVRYGVKDIHVALNKLSPNVVSALGGVAVLCDLFSAVPASDPISVAEEVRSLGAARRAAALFGALGQRVANREITPSDALEMATRQVAQISSASASANAMTGQALIAQLSEYENAMISEIAPGFGLSRIDSAMGGFRPGRLHIIAGYPGHGKTTMMVQAMLRYAKHGTVVFVSGETSIPQLTAISVSHLAQVDMSPFAIRRRAVPKTTDDLKQADEEREKIGRALKYLSSVPIVLIEHGAPSVEDLNLYCMRYAPKLLICDYLQLMKPPATARNREQEVAANALGLKSLAMRHRIAVLTGSQLNREGMVRESDAPRHHCDVLIHIVAQDELTNSEMLPVSLVVHKNRGGATVKQDAVFNRRFATFAAEA